MARSCKMSPDNSKLFPELNKYFKDNGFSSQEARSFTKEIWPQVVSSEFQNTNELEYYDNPECKFKEPTLESVIKAANLDELVSQKNDVNKANKEIGNTYKSKKVFDNYFSAAKEATFLNKKMQKVNAQVVKNVNGYSIQVTNRNIQNEAQPSELVFQSTLANKLLNIVRSAGFEVKVEDVVRHNGSFSPKEAEATARGLMTVINIAKGQVGEEQFPEEFSHMIIAGTRHIALTARLLDTLRGNEDAVKEILGDSYETYMKLYDSPENTNTKEYLLAEEAAGQLLTNKLIYKNENSKFTFLVNKIWTKAKAMLAKLSNNTVKQAIAEAQSAAYDLATIADTKEIIPYLDDIEILKSDTLHKIEKDVDRLKKISDNILKLQMKKMQLARMKSPTGKYTKRDMEDLHDMEANIKREDYYNMYLNFMQDVISLYKNLKADLDEEFRIRKLMNIDNRKDIQKLSKTATILRQFIDFKDSYLSVIEDMASVDVLREYSDINLTDEQAQRIADEASKILSFMSKTTNAVINEMQFNTVLDFLKMFAGDKLLAKTLKDKYGNEVEYLESVLKRGTEINFIDKTINSLANCSDVILQLIDKAVKTYHVQRNQKLVDFKNAFLAYTEDFVKKGGDPAVLLERDEKGKKTGRLISNIDFIKYEKDKKAEEERIEKQYADKSRAYKMNVMESWIKAHTQEEIVMNVDIQGNKIANDSSRVQRIPRLRNSDGSLLYEKPDSEKLENKLTPEQLDYYHKFMFLKRSLDAAMPASEVNVYLAPQMLNSALEGIKAKDNKGKATLDAIKQTITRRQDLGERGFIPNLDEMDGVFMDEESIKEYEKQVNTDLNGKPIQKIPIYLNRPLSDMDRLSEDVAGSMLAYAGMVYNYIEMSEITDLLEITRDYVKNKRDYSTSRGVKLRDKLKVMGHEETIYPTVKGTDTRVGSRIDDYYQMVLYGKMKADEVVVLNGKEIDTAQLLDMLKAYTGALGLGVNVFAGISNELMGKIQMFIESRAKEYFNTKDFAKAGGAYTKEIWNYLGEFNKIQKKSKMSLFIDKFDVLDEFFNNAKYEDYYASPLARIIGKGNLYILNNMGEHILHTQGAIAMLMHQKVRVKQGNTWIETNLYDAYKVIESKDDITKTTSYDLELPYHYETDEEGRNTRVYDVEILDETGKEPVYKQLTNKDLNELKLKIGAVNRRMHGAFNDEDRGAATQYGLMRLVMQFRQWMPEYYMNRWGKKRDSAILDTEVEGFYRTATRFLLDTFKDIKRGDFQLKTIGKNLKPWEIANLKRMTTEVGIFIGLLALISILGDLDDKKGYWEKRMLAYQLRRLQMEVGTALPSSDMFKNILQILQSPAAAINSFGGLLNIFKVWNMNNMIESGRYKGWSKWHRDVYKAVPIIQQIQRVEDIKDEDYMFAIFPV